MKNGGWLHATDGETSRVQPVTQEKVKAKLNVTELMREWKSNTLPEWIDQLATELGVSRVSLVALGVAWAAEHRAWAFPMFDGYGEPIGIRLRTIEGRKLAVAGSRNGLFIPEMPAARTAWITEGPTSAAAAITLGLFPVSRPSCSGSLGDVPIACRRLGIQRAVIVADNDRDKSMPNGSTWNPGVGSTVKLAEIMKIPTCVYVPPAKDIRDFLRLGGTAEMIHATVKNLVWRVDPKAENL